MRIEIDRVSQRPVVEVEPEVRGRSAFLLRQADPEPAQVRFRRAADLLRERFARVRPAEAEGHVPTDTPSATEGKTFRSAPLRAQTVGSGVTSITDSLASTGR